MALHISYASLLKDHRYASLQSIVDLLVGSASYEPPVPGPELTLRERRLATNGQALQDRMVDTASRGYISAIPSPGTAKELSVVTEFGVYKPDPSSVVDSRGEWPSPREILFRRHKIVLPCDDECCLEAPAAPLVPGLAASAPIDIPSPTLLLSPVPSSSLLSSSFASAASAPFPAAFCGGAPLAAGAQPRRPASAPSCMLDAALCALLQTTLDAPPSASGASPGSFSLPACSPASSLASLPRLVSAAASPLPFTPAAGFPYAFGPDAAVPGWAQAPARSESPPACSRLRPCSSAVVPKAVRPIRKQPAKSRRTLALGFPQAHHAF
eukprot:tig00021318_g20189.t1